MYSQQNSFGNQNNNNAFAYIYGDAAEKLEPTLTSIDQNYKNPVVLFVKQNDTKDPIDYFRFQNTRATDKFEKPSTEMTRVADIIG